MFLHQDDYIRNVLANAKANIEAYSGKEVTLRLIENNSKKTKLSQVKLLQIFCAGWEISLHQLTAKNRTMERVAMRQVCALFMRREGFTFESIGILLGGRDHTSAMHMYHTAMDRLEMEEDLFMHFYVVAEDVYETNSVTYEPKKIQSEASA